MADFFNGQFFLAQSKIMVNNQTSQYELLIFTFYLSRLGIFQCVREILQLSLPIDHPVCKNVGKLQNTMKPFFLNFPWIKNVFLLVPPTVLVIIEDISNFQDFLSILKFIYTPSKRVSKVT